MGGYKILVVSDYRGFHSVRPEAEIFIGLRQRGHDVTIITHSDSEYIPKFLENGINVIKRCPKKKLDKNFIHFLKREIEKESYDILHLFDNKSIRNGVKAVKSIPIKVIAYRGASANMRWYNPINYLKFFHSRIDAVICNSQEIKQHYEAIPFGKIESFFIKKGHRLQWYDDVAKYTIRKELKISKDTLIFTTIANNRKVKGIDVLLKAISKLEKDLDIVFLLIGRKMESYHDQKFKNSDKIKFLGYRKDAIEIVASSDVYICPSTGSEALTKSVIEAMSLGVPAIISDLDGNLPLVDHKKNGLIFENWSADGLRDCIDYLYSNGTQIAILGEMAKEKIENDLNIEDTILQYEELYNQL